MHLHEYQAKALFAESGIPVARGEVVNNPEEVYRAARKFNCRVVLKSQVLTGGRNHAGGIKFADTPEEAREHAHELFGKQIKGHTVYQVLVVPYYDITRSLYLAITNDRTARCPLILASAEGGTYIEDIHDEMPEKILRVFLAPLLGLRSYQIVEIASALDVPRELWDDFSIILRGLHQCFINSDATVCEINPLALIKEQGALKFLAIDSKITLDGNALYRHPELARLRDNSGDPPEEIQARAAGLSYVKLSGQIGCMVNGSALAMTAMDITGMLGDPYGISPANFLDIGGGADENRVATALHIIFPDPEVKVILINIFGGITRCDEVARGIVKALEEQHTRLPLIVRLIGTRQEKGREILRQADLTDIIQVNTLYEAAQLAVNVVRKVNHGHSG